MHVSNFNKAYIIDKSKKQLESCRTLGTPWQPSWNSVTNSSSLSVLFFSRQKFLSLFPFKFILFSFLSHYIGITVCGPRQTEHAHTTVGTSVYLQSSDIISNFLNPTIATLPSRTLLKGTVILKNPRLKAAVVNSNCWLHESMTEVLQHHRVPQKQL